MELILVYIIGVLVARLQLQYWLKDRLLLDEDYQLVMILSALSWGIYPAYIINFIVEYLSIKE